MKKLNSGLILFAAMLVCLLLANLSGYSQSLFEITIGKDSFIAVPKDSALLIYFDYINYDQCIQEREALDSITTDLRKQSTLQEKVINKQAISLADYKAVVDNQQTIILNTGKSLDQWQGKYIRMVHWKNLEVIGGIIFSGFVVWKMSK